MERLAWLAFVAVVVVVADSTLAASDMVAVNELQSGDTSLFDTFAAAASVADRAVYSLHPQP